ncbi:TonB-dependent receptor [Parvicella tangerina]|uniref:TonB-dependent receptor n=1 Tax=Parvicella tangerina TaxID=2829795 RepID=A0A916NDI2_9FLAO|nr:TonB-dependent receptor [Parvicella tangerina]CAG5085400.1 hypothetical protein CRYO30217_02748 [Parvicella tangerina]
MKTRFLFIVLGILSYSNFISQFNISGKVTSENGEPLVGATIQFKDAYTGSITDDQGNYIIKNVSNGAYTLIVRYIGFYSIEKTIEVAGNDQELSFELKEAEVILDQFSAIAIKAQETTPTTYSNITKADIRKANFAQDLPYLLDQTPSTVVTSDAGAGVGYTGVRIRGVDPTRTNVTVNGIPLNDPESHGVWWVNMPDFASSVDGMQVQRGVGTSTNGAAAFGASINIQTNEINEEPYAILDNAFGSFNTMRNTVKVGTGLIDGKFSFDGRLSRITSDGYVDRASSNLKSFYLSGAWLGKKSSLRANVFSGKERTYQAWWGTHESIIEGDEDAINAFADRNWLSDEERERMLTSGRTYNYYTYENEVDNYQQDHYQLHFTHKFNKKLNINLSGHYTYGAGYYEQYLKNEDLATYGLDYIELSSDTITNSNIIRQLWLENQFYGGVYSINFNHKGLKLTLGGAGNFYDGDHFGKVIWAEYASNGELGDHYYDNNATKLDINSYLKGTWTKGKLTLFGDLQVRNIQYEFLGLNDLGTNEVEGKQQVDYTFFNPKAGISYEAGKGIAYASFAVANREPVRNDFVQATPSSYPQPETLMDLEAGYRYRSKRLSANVNVYHMNYKNQLILTGEINNVGAYNRTNVDKSYRAGVEMEIGYQLLKNLNIGFNGTFSQNKIPTFIEYIDDYDNGGQIEIVHENVDLGFSPNVIVGGSINYQPLKGLTLSLLPKYVGKQYLDNTQNENRVMDAYFVTHFRASYSLKNIIGKELSIAFQLNNITNTLYENNGYTYSYYAGGETITENFYYPQAGRNFLTSLYLKF